jgi:hypothetical protein
MLQMRRCSESFRDALGEFDLYGQEVKLTYKGKESYSTMPGLLVSLFIILVLLSFAGFKLYILSNRINPNISQ